MYLELKTSILLVINIQHVMLIYFYENRADLATLLLLRQNVISLSIAFVSIICLHVSENDINRQRHHRKFKIMSTFFSQEVPFDMFVFVVLLFLP